MVRKGTHRIFQEKGFRAVQVPVLLKADLRIKTQLAVTDSSDL